MKIEKRRGWEEGKVEGAKASESRIESEGIEIVVRVALRRERVIDIAN